MYTGDYNGTIPSNDASGAVSLASSGTEGDARVETDTSFAGGNSVRPTGRPFTSWERYEMACSLPPEQPVEPAPFVRVQPRVPERSFPAPVRLQIVLNENADAVRATPAVANCVDAVSVAQHHMPCLGFGAKHNSPAGTGVPTAWLFEPGQIIHQRCGSGNHQAKALGTVQWQVVLAAQQHETVGTQFLKIIARQREG